MEMTGTTECVRDYRLSQIREPVKRKDTDLRCEQINDSFDLFVHDFLGSVYWTLGLHKKEPG